MSRTSLHRPRRPRAACHRPATDTRLLPSPHSRLDHSLGWGIPLALSGVEGSQERNRRGLLPSPPHLNSHYKRCPKALRLCLRSDQSPSRPLYGRSPDKSRHPLSKGHRQVRAPLIRRIRFASSGDALEHSVMSPPRAIVPPWAIAPFSDSPGLDLAGQSEQSDERRLKTNAPFLDSTVVTTGELRSTNAGLGSTLPSLGMVEHFWWSRLPHSETSSRLLHILSEVRGCRKVGIDVEHPLSRTTPIGTGVAVFLRNRPGPSIPSPLPPQCSLPPLVRPACRPGCGRPDWGVHTPHPPFYHSEAPRGRRCALGVNLGLARSPFPPLTSPHSRKDPPISPSPPPSSQEKSNSPRKQSKFTPEPAHQSKSSCMTCPSASSDHGSEEAVSVVPPMPLG